MQKFNKFSLYIPSKSFYEQFPKDSKYFVTWLKGNYGIKRKYIPTTYLFSKNLKYLNLPTNPLKKIITINSKIHNHFFLSLQKTIVGTTVGFKKYLRVKGVGYKILVLPDYNLEIIVGYTHSVKGKLHPESQFKLTRKARMLRVGALNLCTLMTNLYKVKNQKKPDPYRLKGIRFRKERVSRKLVKKRRKSN